MLRQLAVFLAVAQQGLPLAALDADGHILVAAGIGKVMPFDQEHVLAVAYQSALGHGLHGTRHAEEMDALKKVAFAHAVAPHETVHSLGEVQAGLPDVLEVHCLECGYEHDESV